MSSTPTDNGFLINGIEYTHRDFFAIFELEKDAEFYFSKVKGGWSHPKYQKVKYFRFDTLEALMVFAIENGEYAKINGKVVSYFGYWKPHGKKWEFRQGRVNKVEE